MEEYLQHHTVLESELEECIWDYYRQTAPSLQEFYSRYTPEWEVFYEHETLPPTDFLIFLQQMVDSICPQKNTQTRMEAL